MKKRLRNDGQLISPSDVIEKLLQAVNGVSPDLTNGEWTQRVLRSLASLDSSLCVDPAATVANDNWSLAGEWLWDLALSRFPQYAKTPYGYPNYFAAIEDPELVLVAECEWGKALNRRGNGYEVMSDFLKLLSARSALKVMVFAYFREAAPKGEVSSTFEELLAHMHNILDRSNDTATYVLFGVDSRGQECRWRTWSRVNKWTHGGPAVLGASQAGQRKTIQQAKRASHSR